MLEKIDVMLPGDADQHEHAVLCSRVEQPRRRKRVGAHGVQAAAGHVGEVAGDRSRLRVKLAASIGAEGAICCTTQIQLAVADEQEPASGMRTHTSSRAVRLRAECCTRDNAAPRRALVR